jgi:hypothetical protein
MLKGGISARSFVVIFALCALALPISAMFWLQPVNGDLTRIGRLPEVAFGRNASQPSQRRQLGNVDTLGASNVLVLGDSFSLEGLWQFAAFGERTRYNTLRLLSEVCEDLPDLLRAQGASPQILVLEMVERHLKDYTSPGCKQSRIKWVKDKAQSATMTEADRPRQVFGGEYGYRYVAGATLFLLSPGEQQRRGPYGGVQVKAVDDGCLLFSNTRCDLGLFLGWDSTKRVMDGNLSAAMSTNLTFAMRAAPRVVLIVVPNKSSVYLESLEEARRKDRIVRDLASDTLLAVPLFERFHKAARERRDFYLPNDTHLSPAGQVFMGHEVRAVLDSLASGVRGP